MSRLSDEFWTFPQVLVWALSGDIDLTRSMFPQAALMDVYLLVQDPADSQIDPEHDPKEWLPLEKGEIARRGDLPAGSLGYVRDEAIGKIKLGNLRPLGWDLCGAEIDYFESLKSGGWFQCVKDGESIRVNAPQFSAAEVIRLWPLSLLDRGRNVDGHMNDPGITSLSLSEVSRQWAARSPDLSPDDVFQFLGAAVSDGDLDGGIFTPEGAPCSPLVFDNLLRCEQALARISQSALRSFSSSDRVTAWLAARVDLRLLDESASKASETLEREALAFVKAQGGNTSATSGKAELKSRMNALGFPRVTLQECVLAINQVLSLPEYRALRRNKGRPSASRFNK